MVPFFLLLDNIPLSGCTRFIHSYTEGHLGYFLVLAVMIKVAMIFHAAFGESKFLSFG